LLNEVNVFVSHDLSELDCKILANVSEILIWFYDWLNLTVEFFQYSSLNLEIAP